METIRKIRCAYHRDKKGIRRIAREFNLSRNTVKKVMRGDTTEFLYDRKAQRQGFEGGHDSVRRYVQKWRRSEEGKSLSGCQMISRIRHEYDERT